MQRSDSKPQPTTSSSGPWPPRAPGARLAVSKAWFGAVSAVVALGGCTGVLDSRSAPAGGSEQCAVSQPIAVGDDYRVRFEHLKGQWSYRADVQLAGATESHQLRGYDDGRTSLTLTADTEGSGRVNLYRKHRGHEWLRAQCRFDVGSSMSTDAGSGIDGGTAPDGGTGSDAGTGTDAGTDAATGTDGGDPDTECQGDGSNVDTVRDAVAAADVGDTLVICDGTYVLPPNDPVVIDKSLHLAAQNRRQVRFVRNEPEEVLDADSRSLIWTDQDDVTMDGFVIRGDPDSDQYSGIQVEGADNFRFLNGTVEDIRSDGSIPGTGGYGILPIGDVANLIIDNSIFRRTRHGVTAAQGDDITDMVVRDSLFTNHSDDAIDNHYGATGTKIIGNTIRPGPLTLPGKTGVLLQGTEGWTMRGNLVEDCQPTDPDGCDGTTDFMAGLKVQYIPDGPETEIRGRFEDNTVTASVRFGLWIESDIGGTPSDLPVDVCLAGANEATHVDDYSFWYEHENGANDYAETTSTVTDGHLTFPPTSFTAGSCP